MSINLKIVLWGLHTTLQVPPKDRSKIPTFVFFGTGHWPQKSLSLAYYIACTHIDIAHIYGKVTCMNVVLTCKGGHIHVAQLYIGLCFKVLRICWGWAYRVRLFICQAFISWVLTHMKRAYILGWLHFRVLTCMFSHM